MDVLSGLKSLVGVKSPASSSVKNKLIVIEDDQYLRDFYVDLLTTEGYEVISAENGQIGLEMIKTQRPLLVLLDLMMPVMDGKDMLHALRAIPEYKNLPVIVLTNAGNTDNMQETQLFYNVSAFFVKSNVRPEEIIQKVASLIPVAY